MATQSQITANQANAKHSTGPKTAAGKARVAQNATRHGLTAKNLVVRADEREEFEAFQADLLAEIEPKGATEFLTFNQLLHAAWNLCWFRRLEAESFRGTTDDLTNPETAAALDRLARYQAATERAYYHALQEIRRLQTNRSVRLLHVTESLPPHYPAMTDIAILAKQSRLKAGPLSLVEQIGSSMREMEKQQYKRMAERRRAGVEEVA